KIIYLRVEKKKKSKIKSTHQCYSNTVHNYLKGYSNFLMIQEHKLGNVLKGNICTCIAMIRNGCLITCLSIRYKGNQKQLWIGNLVIVNTMQKLKGFTKHSLC